MASDAGILLPQFFAWNPDVSEDYLEKFWAGYAYCVGVSGSSTTYHHGTTQAHPSSPDTRETAI